MPENLGIAIYFLDLYGGIINLLWAILIIGGCLFFLFGFISILDEQFKTKFSKFFLWKTYIGLVILLTIMPSPDKLPLIMFADPLVKEMKESATINKLSEMVDLYIEKSKKELRGE